MKQMFIAFVFLWPLSLLAGIGPTSPAPASSHQPTVPAPQSSNSSQLQSKGYLSIDSIPDLKLELQASTNWYLVFMPFVTIAVVLASMAVTLRTIRVNGESTRAAFLDTVSAQREIAERELKSKVLAGNRQAWINDLRSDLAEFIATAYQLRAHFTIMEQKPAGHEFTDMYAKLELKKAKIALMINPIEKDHMEIVSKTEAIRELLGEKEGQAHKLIAELTEISQSVLKREWERVKLLE